MNFFQLPSNKPGKVNLRITYCIVYSFYTHSQKYFPQITEILLVAVLPIDSCYLKNLSISFLHYRTENIRQLNKLLSSLVSDTGYLVKKHTDLFSYFKNSAKELQLPK